MSIRVRFAPSPTGYLHVGGARTALFNWLFARHHGGSFVLRIEDTDQDRNQEQSLFPILTGLEWLGLDIDEGPILKRGKITYKGDFAPYKQSERLSIYKEKALELIKKDQAYYCFMSQEEEEKKKEEAIKEKKAFRVKSPYRDLNLKEAEEKIKKGESYSIRFKVKERSEDYKIKDLVRGEVQFPSDSLGDFILIRSDGFPVYNFSCAVDDSLMKISHVFRAEEHLSNSLKQSLIQEALGFTPPQFGHLSIILDEDKKKLSKRSGAQSLEHWKKEGYMKEALTNFLALLGWNPGTEQEFFKKEDLIKNFSIERVNLSSAVFDQKKLLWLNEEHIKSLSDKDLEKSLKDFLTPDFDENLLKDLIPKLRTGFKTFSQAAKLLEKFSDKDFKIKETALDVLRWPKTKLVIKSWIEFLENLNEENLSLEDFKLFQKEITKNKQIKGKEFFMPLRCALIGEPEGVEIKLIISSLSKKELHQRALKVLEKVETSS